MSRDKAQVGDQPRMKTLNQRQEVAVTRRRDRFIDESVQPGTERHLRWLETGRDGTPAFNACFITGTLFMSVLNYRVDVLGNQGGMRIHTHTHIYTHIYTHVETEFNRRYSMSNGCK